MKKLLLATAIAALSVSAANAAPTVYGKAFVTMDYVNADDGAKDSDSVQINSNSSRIGFKGSEAMTANTDVVYQLEYGIDIDNDADDNFKNRDTYLGLNNKTYGEFRFGHNTSSTDYINNVLVSDAYFDNLDSFMADSSRQKNSVLWLAPKYNGLPLQVVAMYSADERFVESSGDRNNGYGVSAMFDQGTGFTAGLSYDKDLNIAAGGDIMRGTATVDLGKYMAAPVTLGALYQVADFDGGAKDEKGLLVSAQMGLANFAKPASVYAQYNNTSNKDGIANVDADQIVVGGKYFYQPNMIMHAYAGASTIEQPGQTDDDAFAIGGGLEYKF
jgi:predicted porin